MTKEDFGNSTEGWICNNDDNYLKVRDNCYMIGKYRGSAHKDCNILN